MFSSQEHTDLLTLLHLREAIEKLEYHCSGPDDDPGVFTSIEPSKVDPFILQKQIESYCIVNRIALTPIKIEQDAYGRHITIHENLLGNLKNSFEQHKEKLDAIFSKQLDATQLSDLLYLRNAFNTLNIFSQQNENRDHAEIITFSHLFPGLIDLSGLNQKLSQFIPTKDLVTFNISANNELGFQINGNALRMVELKFFAHAMELNQLSQIQYENAKTSKKVFDPNSITSLPQEIPDQLAALQEKILANSPDQLKFFLLLLLRFSPMEKIDNLITAYADQNLANKNGLSQTYKEVREYFCSKAPYFARYSHLSDLRALQTAYVTNNFVDLKTTCENDMKYGEEREALTKGLCAQLSDSNASYSPTQNSAFDSLPPSSTNTKRVAALLEKISAWNYGKQNENNFKTLRTVQFQTPIAGRYAWAQPLVESVLKFSQSDEVSKSEEDHTYKLYYKSGEKYFEVNKVTCDNTQPSSIDSMKWMHGRLPVSTTWDKVEDLFESLWAMDLTKPDENATPIEKAEYENKLTGFYSTVAELVWLIGNTQPLNRGSGTVAELILSITHLHHNLPPPVLKLDFPQLDVLDITFPLNDYKRFFPFFFEQTTIPKHLRNPDTKISALPLSKQIEKLYHDNQISLSETPVTNIKSPDTSSSTTSIATVLEINLKKTLSSVSQDPAKSEISEAAKAHTETIKNVEPTSTNLATPRIK